MTWKENLIFSALFVSIFVVLGVAVGACVLASLISPWLLIPVVPLVATGWLFYVGVIVDWSFR